MDNRFYYLVFLVLQLGLQCIGAQQSKQQPYLEGKSFELTTKITQIGSHEECFIHQVSEKYSQEQRRAKIYVKSTYRLLALILGESSPSADITSGTYFVDKTNDLFLFLDEREHKCHRSNLQDLGKHLTFESMAGLPKRPDESHIVGPARLLMMIADNKNKLERTERASTIRNVDLVVYSLELMADAKFLVYYYENDDINDPQTNPIRVIYHDNRSSIIFDFSPIKLIQQEASSSAIQRQVESSQVSLDEFSFPPMSGCSELAKDFAFQLPSKPKSPVRFSFTAEVRQKLIGKETTSSFYKTFVAYDETLSSLRVDFLESDSALSPARLMYDFNSNKVYYLRADQSKESKQKANNVIEVDKSSPGDCVIGKITGSYQVEVHVNLVELLAGSKEAFIYLGRGLVRGMGALVFEVVDTEPPFWLEPASADVNHYAAHEKQQADATVGQTHTILYYFGDQETDRPLLRMEIYGHDKGDREKVHSYQAVDVFHFGWQLDSIAPSNGDRSGEMFSLRDLCADKQAAISQVELVIDQETSQLGSSTTNWLTSGTQRNQAVMCGLHEALKLSAANVFDLETRLVSSSDHKKSSIHVAFRHTPHSMQFTDLVYVGRGHLKADPESQVERLEVLSFRDCFMAAAQKQGDVYLGYDRISRVCLVDLEGSSSLQTNPKNFALSAESHLEIYNTYSGFRLQGQFLAAWAQESSALERYMLRGKSMKLGLYESNGERPTFRINAVHVTENKVGHTTGVDPTIVQKESQQPLSEIQGYALSLDDFEYNQRIESIELDQRLINPYATASNQENNASPNELEMTPGTCHARCLNDVTCQSYSVCVANYKVECIVSKLSFKSADILRELNSAVRAKTGSRITVRANNAQRDDAKNQQAKLIKRPACTLYNKQYLNLFDKSPNRSKLRLKMVQIKPAESREQCAVECARKNLELNDKFSAMSKEEMFEISNKQLKEDDNLSWNKIIELNYCPGFMYMSLTEVRNLPDESRRAFESQQSDKEDINGYCMRTLDYFDLSGQYQIIEPEMYFFRATNLYEETRGLALMGTELDVTEMMAVEKVRSNLNPTWEEVEVVKAMAGRGENFQDNTRNTDKSRCAVLCFLQTVNPWPACRSFDVIVERRKEGSIVGCRFNSATLSHVLASRKYDLIENQTEQVQMWHYEPRVGLVLDSLNLAGQIETSSSEQRAYNRKYGSRGHLSFMFVLLLALSTGFWAGIVVHRRYLTDLTFASPPQRTISIEQLVMENNQVRFDLPQK